MKRTRVLALTALLLLVVGACRAAEPELRLGARAIALDLAFSADELAEPVEPERIVQIIPAPPELASGDATLQEVALPQGGGVAPSPTAEEDPACPAAPEGAAPTTVAPVGIVAPPVPGRYQRHNEGTFGIKAGPLDITLPFPPVSRDDVSPPREVAPPGLAETVAPSGSEPAEQKGSGVFEWHVLHTITPTFTTDTTYRLTADALAIVRRVTRTDAGEQVFQASPPVNLIELNRGPGASWRSAGVDRARRTALSLEGRIEKAEAVDLCGVLVDTQRVVTTETFVNLETGQTSGTDPGKSNVYNVATQYGGLIVRTEQHYSQRSRDERTGTPIIISYDYASTMDSFQPARR